MTVDIGFFPDGFLEEMSGMTKLANGVYVQGDSPRYKQFRWSFPVTDEDGKEIIYNFPVCQIESPDFNAETETDEKKENISQVTIKAFPPLPREAIFLLASACNCLKAFFTLLKSRGKTAHSFGCQYDTDFIHIS